MSGESSDASHQSDSKAEVHSPSMGLLHRIRKKLIISIAFAACIFLAISIYSDFDKVASSLAKFKLWYLPLVLGLAFTNYVLRFLKWHYYLRLLDVRIKWTKSFKIFLAGLTMSISPGRFGEVIKSLFVKMVDGSAIAKTAPIVVAERFTDFIAFLILSAFGAAAFASGGKVLLISTAVTIIVIVVVGSRRLAEPLLELIGKLPLLRRFAHKAVEAYESMYQLIKLRRLVPAVALSVVSWFCECLAFYLVLHSLGITRCAGFVDAVCIYAFSTLAGAITMMPGGIGLTEVSLTGLLVKLPCDSQVDKSMAAAATIIIRLCTLWFAVIVGIIASTLLKDIGEEEREEETSSPQA